MQLHAHVVIAHRTLEQFERIRVWLEGDQATPRMFVREIQHARADVRSAVEDQGPFWQHHPVAALDEDFPREEEGLAKSRCP